MSRSSTVLINVPSLGAEIVIVSAESVLTIVIFERLSGASALSIVDAFADTIVITP
jgi:hypothetical protein